MPNNELQELLGARFDGHTHATNESVWGAIEAQLDAEKSDRVGIWFWIFNGLAATLLIGIMFQSSGLSANGYQTLSQLQLSENTTKEAVKVNNPKEQVQSAQDNSTVSSETHGEDINVRGEITNSDNAGSNKSIHNGSHISSNSNKTSLNSDLSRIKNESLNSTSDKGGQNDSELEATEFIVSMYPYGKDVDLTVGELATRPFASPTERNFISKDPPKTAGLVNSNVLRQLPIHLGFECSYLNRTRTNSNEPYFQDSSNSFVNNGLANSRNFEFSLFTQFDFTKRFSASVGLGYSQSKFELSEEWSNALSQSNDPTESKMQLLTIPVQAKMDFFQKNRFALSLGLTFQSEFGKFEHTKLVPGNSSGGGGTVSELTTATFETNSLSFRQFSFEPFLQLSFKISPRISTFANLGFRSYLNQSNAYAAPIGRLNYFNADVGFQVRIQ